MLADPLLDSANPAVLFEAFDSAVRDESYAPAFCCTLALISRAPRDSNDPIPWEDGSTGWHAQEKFSMLLCFGLGWSDKATWDINAYEQYRGKEFARAVLAVGIMSEVLRQGGYTQDQVITPTAADIDFHSMRDLPPPFCPYAPRAMESRHLPMMTSKRFLEDGEWTGLYCCSLGRGRPISWDPPMRGIHFTTRIDPDAPGKIFLAGSGTDRVGSFMLEGCLHSEDGLCTMSKEYGPHHRWFWDAYMTPFGIVGTWGSFEWGGWVWLWKASWLSRQA